MNFCAAANARIDSAPPIAVMSKYRMMSRRSRYRISPGAAAEICVWTGLSAVAGASRVQTGAMGAAGAMGALGATGATGALGARRWNSTNAICCGSPSSVMAKSLAVSPSIARPSLSFTVTVSTMRRVSERKTGCCAARRKDGTGDEEIRRTASTTYGDTHQNLTRRLDSSLRMAFARLGSPNCGLPTMVFRPA